jgi:hypothetical protein
MPESVRMIYLGQRGSREKPLSHAWVAEDNPTGSPGLFRKVKGTAVGSIYEVQVERDNGEIRSAYLNPTYTGDQYDDDVQVAAWKALDQQARHADRMRRLEKRNAGSAELDAALEPLNAMACKNPRRDANPPGTRLPDPRQRPARGARQHQRASAGYCYITAWLKPDTSRPEASNDNHRIEH